MITDSFGVPEEYLKSESKAVTVAFLRQKVSELFLVYTPLRSRCFRSGELEHGPYVHEIEPTHDVRVSNLLDILHKARCNPSLGWFVKPTDVS